MTFDKERGDKRSGGENSQDGENRSDRDYREAKRLENVARERKIWKCWLQGKRQELKGH